jgi:hypothetical protein
MRDRIEQCFSMDYASARARFVKAALAAGAQLASFPCEASGPVGEHLAMDAAYLGAPDAANILVISSGVHGVEGYAGSAIQIDLLRSGWNAVDTALLLVHFVNPYGMAWSCNDNEDGVDLNRNFLDFAAPLPVNRHYDDLDEFIRCPDREGVLRDTADARIAAYLEERGFDTFIRAIADGQHHRPGGYNFGGQSRSWSNQTLRALLTQHCLHADRVGVIDVHTGLGGRGEAVMLCIEPPDEASATRASSWWQNFVLVPGPDFPFSPHGTFVGAVWDFGLPGELTAAALEIGTEPPERAFAALRDRYWLTHFGQYDSPTGEAIVSEMHACLAPRDEAWRVSVLNAGHAAVAGALRGLETASHSTRSRT